MKLLFLRLMGSVLLLSLVACGGGGSSAPATVTGTLVDSFVAGVNYTCSSGMSGITNASGEFTCGANDTVEFFLGAYLLGTCSAQETVTPYDLFPADEAAAVNVARLLQTLDENGDPSDGITVPADFTQLDAVTVAPGGASFDTDVNTALGTTLVTALDAQNHMDGVIVTSLFAGKTLYTTIYDAMGTLEQWAFSADMTQAVWTELVGGSDSGSATLSVDGRVLTADDGTGTETITIAEINDDYIVITFSDGTSQRLYFNRAAAEAYFQVVVAEPLESIIGGQTFYTTIDDTMGTLESWAFNATATQGTWTELVGGSETGNVSVSINGMVMTFTEPEGTEVITVTEVTTDYLILTFSDSSTLRIYFDRATAETYFQVATTTTLQSIIGGQTFYTTIYDMMGTLESWTFNTDATQGTWTELVGGSETGNVSVSINGMVMTFTEPEGTEVITVSEVTTDYLLLTFSDSSTLRIYFDRATAEAYFGVSTPNTSTADAALVGTWVLSTIYSLYDGVTYSAGPATMEMTIALSADGTHSASYTDEDAAGNPVTCYETGNITTSGSSMMINAITNSCGDTGVETLSYLLTGATSLTITDPNDNTIFSLIKQ